MGKNSLNTNKQFMIGNGILAFGVLAVVIIFLYMSFRFKRDANKAVTYEGVYNIEVSKDFAGDSIAIYVNDSLLMNRTMPDASLKLEINRFAEGNVLMVVDNKTDKTTPFNLNPNGSKVIVKKDGEVIYILEKEMKHRRRDVLKVICITQDLNTSLHHENKYWNLFIANRTNCF